MARRRGRWQAFEPEARRVPGLTCHEVRFQVRGFGDAKSAWRTRWCIVTRATLEEAEAAARTIVEAMYVNHEIGGFSVRTLHPASFHPKGDAARSPAA